MFSILRLMKTKTAAKVAYHLFDIFTTLGAPAILQSDNRHEKNAESLINQIKRTNDIREIVREDQKRQAHEFLQNTAKPQKLANSSVCDNVVISFSTTDVDRDPTDTRNVLAVFMEIKHEKFRFSIEQGVPFCLL
ncbi:unnamed protein product [Rotaria magnacalcarata]|uniref:Uncharacterized protein n=3 Tax=Rotaria magnacalcarata TaxID=392030 RepID=A0A815BZU2_9BILA|nr:unnamed protein product [Rotaria magnacalcarata]